MANNFYPQHLTEAIIQNSLDKHFQTIPVKDENVVKFFFQLHNLSRFKQDTKTLKNIFQHHIKAKAPYQQATINTYFKPRKLETQFSTRRTETRQSVCELSNVVYSFNCSEDGCNASYVGYTTNKLSTRIKQHRYRPSNIYDHFTLEHDKLPPKFDQLKDSFRVLYKSYDTISVKLAEAILIKTERPYINVKYSNMSNFVKLI